MTEYLTVADVSRLLRLKPSTVYALKDQIGCHRFGPKGGAVRFDPADIEAYLRKTKIKEED